MAYFTPGVYVEEISLLPPSVVEVSTAIPAFIGHTEKSPTTDPTAVSSMREYIELFGGPDKTTVAVTNNIPAVKTLGIEKYLLYYQVSMFFRNGGGRCFIVSVGSYTSNVSLANLNKGIAALDKEDEPTLILMPDVIRMDVVPADNTSTPPKPAKYPAYEICNDVLLHCSTKKDRFALFDVKYDERDNFRNAATVSLSYGAGYTPFLQTSLGFLEDYVEITISNTKKTLASLRTSETDADRKLYNDVRELLSRQTLTLPPCGAIAGLYARIDRDRGVWKAPANVGLVGVTGPEIKLSDTEQESLNVHAASGKSINAIRSFAGQGTLVWGARTLDGNSNEWRYINVRRLFIMMEESIQKATRFAVFEPNTASTWLKVKAMVESFLFGLWQRGALAGASPEDAYFVQVGATPDEINNGFMKVQIGAAAVRPAEFIILQFSHKMQEG